MRCDLSAVAGEKTKRVCTFRPLLEDDKFAEGALSPGSGDYSVRKFWPFPRATLAEALKIPYATKEVQDRGKRLDRSIDRWKNFISNTNIGGTAVLHCLSLRCDKVRSN